MVECAESPWSGEWHQTLLAFQLQRLCNAEELCLQNWGRCWHSHEYLWRQGRALHQVWNIFFWYFLYKLKCNFHLGFQFLIHMSKIWICVISHICWFSCLAVCWSVISLSVWGGKKFNAGHNAQTFQPDFFFTCHAHRNQCPLLFGSSFDDLDFYWGSQDQQKANAVVLSFVGWFGWKGGKEMESPMFYILGIPRQML